MDNWCPKVAEGTENILRNNGQFFSKFDENYNNHRSRNSPNSEQRNMRKTRHITIKFSKPAIKRNPESTQILKDRSFKEEQR